MGDYWRDLEIGEEVQVGDRFLDCWEWVVIEPIHLEFVNVVTQCSKPTQRKVNSDVECDRHYRNGFYAGWKACVKGDEKALKAIERRVETNHGN